MSAHTAAAQLAEDRVVRDCRVNHWREILRPQSPQVSIYILSGHLSATLITLASPRPWPNAYRKARHMAVHRRHESRARRGAAMNCAAQQSCPVPAADFDDWREKTSATLARIEERQGDGRQRPARTCATARRNRKLGDTFGDNFVPEFRALRCSTVRCPTSACRPYPAHCAKRLKLRAASMRTAT